MSPRQATSLVLAWAIGLLLPLVCVPDALAPEGHGWHLVLDAGEVSAHHHEPDATRGHAGHLYIAPSGLAAGPAALGPITGGGGSPRTSGLPDVAPPPGATNADLAPSIAPGPEPVPGTLPWVLGDDLTPPPRSHSS